MTYPIVCPVDGCEWPIPTQRPYPGPVATTGESVLRRSWDTIEEARVDSALEDHYSKHTTVEWLNTIVRLSREVSGDA